MLSKNGRQRRISSRKMAWHSLPFARVRSTKQECCNKAEGGPKPLNLQNYSRNGHRLGVFFVLSVFLLSATCRADSNRCAVGLNTPGRTSPAGDILLQHGQPLKIYCILNETDPRVHGKNASDLVFLRHSEEMEPEYITVVNSTTIVMSVKDLGPSEDMYYCKLKLSNNREKYEAVCLNKVIVGFKPQEPRNFSCVSMNWNRLTCTWEPIHNYISTRYSLHFKIPGQSSSYDCPNTSLSVRQPQNSCSWTKSTDPSIRQVYSLYMFTLRGENVLGIENFPYKFHHYENMIPARPVGLKVIEKTYSSVLLYWAIPFPMQTFPPGLDHRISYQSQYHRRDIWVTIDLKEANEHEKYFNLTNLQYANAEYDVRVFLKSKVATGDNRWSNFSAVTFKTAATLPDRSPRTDVGSFEAAVIKGKRDIFVYWQTIPSYLENGDNFTYEVVAFAENGTKLNIQPYDKNKTYARFKGMSSEMLKFEITSTNCKGKSLTKSVVTVPSYSKMPPEPTSFTTIAKDYNIYELSWHPPKESNVTSYTIFWCENDRDRPFQCTGYLSWVQLPPNETVYSFNASNPVKIYQFAISANTGNTSSGMGWASCVALHNQTVRKMKSVSIINTGSDQIVLGWKLDCSDRIDTVKGFKIYYCPITEKPEILSCKDPEMNTTVTGGPNLGHGVVTSLKPYTTYMLAVAVLTDYGEGERSDSCSTTTLEAASTPPQDLKVTNLTNTTITVEWKRPVAMNGILRYYTVYYNENFTNAEKNTSLQIRGLEPFKKYRIRVSAMTVQESALSEIVSPVTLIGVPGKIDVPDVRFNESNQVHIKWKPPANPGGHSVYYEILPGDDYDNIHTNITGNEAFLPIPDCKNVGREQLFRFRVRAVNLGDQKERFVGPWSDPWKGQCYITEPSAVARIVILIIGCLCGVAVVLFVAYISKRLWIKCKKMRDVEVKLPPGLQPNMKLLEKGNEHIAQQMSADSSGCSSGQESVTSSLTSDSHVSTDSGADLDPVPMSPTKLLESPPTWESSNLRQRNVFGTTRPDPPGDRGRWDPYVKVAKTTDAPAGDSLSLARSTPNLTADGAPATNCVGLYAASQQHAWSSTGYISMPSSEEDSSNNPSPLPRGKGSTQGVYSVVGLAPLLTPRARAGAESRDTERSHPRTADLVPPGTEGIREAAVTNPYVSLASLEQRTRSAGNPCTPSLVDFADIEFDLVGEQQQQLPYSISDKLSKPYVQTGLMDAMRISRDSKQRDDPGSHKVRYPAADTAEPSGGRPPFARHFVGPTVSLSQPLINLSSNAYVPVNTAFGVPSARSAEGSAQVLNPYVAVSTLVSPTDASSPDSGRTDEIADQTASMNHFHAQLAETSRRHEDPVIRPATSVAASLPVVKQTSGYVTIAETTAGSIENSPSENPTMAYVPHQRVNKKSPSPYQQNVGQADEQYSKVTVVPTTT